MTRSESTSEAEWLREVAWLLGQWHTSRNEPLDPKLLRAGSNRRVWWRCPAGHEWQTTIAGRARRGTRCPYCIGQRASASNNLAVTAPEVAATWHPTRNETLTPATVLPKSGRAVWWLCPAGHEWRTSVYARVSLRSGCPYCAGQRATDETSLAQRYPAVAGRSRWWRDRYPDGPRILLRRRSIVDDDGGFESFARPVTEWLPTAWRIELHEAHLNPMVLMHEIAHCIAPRWTGNVAKIHRDRATARAGQIGGGKGCCCWSQPWW